MHLHALEFRIPASVAKVSACGFSHGNLKSNIQQNKLWIGFPAQGKGRGKPSPGFIQQLIKLENLFETRTLNHLTPRGLVGLIIIDNNLLPLINKY